MNIKLTTRPASVYQLTRLSATDAAAHQPAPLWQAELTFIPFFGYPRYLFWISRIIISDIENYNNLDIQHINDADWLVNWTPCV